MSYKGLKIGIALSGGGARGLAHIGVLKALEENNIFPDIVSGCSMGAIVGVLYAAGKSPYQIAEIFREENPNRIIKPNFNSPGLFHIAGLATTLEHVIKKNDFNALKLQFHISVANLNSGKGEIISSGDQLFEFIIASASIPLIFKPSVINGQTYVDGGLFDNLPSEALIGHCHRIIGSHVNPIGIKHELNGNRAIIERCFQLTIEQNVRVSRGFCDYFIEPRKIREYNLWDFGKSKEIIELGYNEATKVIEQFILPELDADLTS